jgi:hypothetical protein
MKPYLKVFTGQQLKMQLLEDGDYSSIACGRTNIPAII